MVGKISKKLSIIIKLLKINHLKLLDLMASTNMSYFHLRKVVINKFFMFRFHPDFYSTLIVVLFNGLPTAGERVWLRPCHVTNVRTWRMHETSSTQPDLEIHNHTGQRHTGQLCCLFTSILQ